MQIIRNKGMPFPDGVWVLALKSDKTQSVGYFKFCIGKPFSVIRLFGLRLNKLVLGSCYGSEDIPQYVMVPIDLAQKLDNIHKHIETECENTSGCGGLLPDSIRVPVLRALQKCFPEVQGYED